MCDSMCAVTHAHAHTRSYDRNAVSRACVYTLVCVCACIVISNSEISIRRPSRSPLAHGQRRRLPITLHRHHPHSFAGSADCRHARGRPRTPPSPPSGVRGATLAPFARTPDVQSAVTTLQRCVRRSVTSRRRSRARAAAAVCAGPRRPPRSACAGCVALVCSVGGLRVGEIIRPCARHVSRVSRTLGFVVKKSHPEKSST